MPNPDPVKWLKTILQLWGGESLLIIAIGIAALLAGVAAYLINNSAASWLIVVGAFFLILGFGKKYQERTVQTCVFIPDEIRSFWYHAKQPDGRELTQFGLRGYVTNMTDQPLYLGKVKLLSPRTKRQHQEFIFTVKNNAVTGAPLSPRVRTEFDTSFFADGFLGVLGKPMNVKVSVCDQFGHWHKVGFNKLRDPLGK